MENKTYCDYVKAILKQLDGLMLEDVHSILECAKDEAAKMATFNLTEFAENV